MMMIPRKRNEFDLFRDFFEGDDFFPIRRESAIMKTDIKEKKDKYIIEMDLPGYEKENIKLSLKDGYVEVTAEVNKEDENETNHNYRRGTSAPERRQCTSPEQHWAGFEKYRNEQQGAAG